MTDLSPLLPAAEALIRRYTSMGLMVATAESCTGGLIAGTLTEVSGSSSVVDRGFVTYSNAAKTALLGVPAALIERVGAVSREVAIAMAEGALERSEATLAVAVTGIAGPNGGTPEKPVGLVHLAVAWRDHATRHDVQRFTGLDRSGVRFATVERALQLLDEVVDG